MIEVDDLTIEYKTLSGRLRAVSRVTFSLAKSEILGLVGESGSGKSTLALALLGHIGGNGSIAAGRILFNGSDLLALPAAARAVYCGRRIGFVPQNPSMGLSPHLRIGSQLVEVALHHGVAGTAEEARRLAARDFALVGLPESDRLLVRYPHELSGGQQQRVCIAMAIACRPDLLVLDEPTTGLDVTTQVRILDLLKDLRSRFGMAMLYVTHDLGLLAQIADRVGVMYAGSLIEIAPAERLFSVPRHPYSRALIASVPSLEQSTVGSRRLRGFLQREKLPPGCPFSPRCEHAEESCAVRQQTLEFFETGHGVACQRWESITPAIGALPLAEVPSPRLQATESATVIELKSVSLAYGRAGWIGRLMKPENANVVEDLSLHIEQSEIFALVGESGSGKSTIARALSGLLVPRDGEIRFAGELLPARLRARPLSIKRAIQYIFQNPDASLNPRERIMNGLARPLRLYFRQARGEIPGRVAKALEDVRLDPSYASRFPDELSGGERQRVAIARGLIAEPVLILCDEVLSALDVSVQASILDLLARLRVEARVAMLFISHDLAVVRNLADRTGVLFRGRLVEVGRTRDLFEPPFHPYTEELLLALPAYRKRLRGSIVAPIATSARAATRGCVYAGRCRYHRGPICDEQMPPWQKTDSGHAIRCHIGLSQLATENLISGRETRRSENPKNVETKDDLVKRPA